MKKIFILILFLYSCNSSDRMPKGKPYNYISLTYDEIKNDLDNLLPFDSNYLAYISANNNYFFISNNESGIHVFDNSDLKNPKNISFIRIPNVISMKVLDNIIYAYSLGDIAILDISNIYNVKLLKRVIINEKKDINIKSNEYIANYNENKFLNIIGNYLYITKSYDNKQEIVILDISNKYEPKEVNKIEIVKNLEIKPFDKNYEIIQDLSYNNNLMVISTNKRLLIYSIEDNKSTIFISEFSYINNKRIEYGEILTSVAINDKNIYIKSSINYLDIINLKDIKAPKIAKSYELKGYKKLNIKKGTQYLIFGGNEIYDMSQDLTLIPIKNIQYKLKSFFITEQEILLGIVDNEGIVQYDISNLDKELKPLSFIDTSVYSNYPPRFNDVEYYN
ncbi:MAG: hypothetical protein U0457_01045 [Candidatus Sericytochromatia bacterium]